MPFQLGKDPSLICTEMAGTFLYEIMLLTASQCIEISKSWIVPY